MSLEIGNRTLVYSNEYNTLSASYDAARCILEIEFHSGSVYQYDNVPADVVDAFTRAADPGEYFAAYIKPMFPTWKLVDGERVAIEFVKVTPKARGYLISLARKHSLCADHPNALIGSAFRSMLRALELPVPADGRTVNDYVENLRHMEASKIIDYLKAL